MVTEIIFIVTYTNAKNKSNYMSPRIMAVQIITAFYMVVIWGLISIINYIFVPDKALSIWINFTNHNYDFFINYILLVLIIYFIYNKKRIRKIEEKYQNTEIFSKKNIITMVLAYLIPFVIMGVFFELRFKGLYFW